MSRSCWTQPVMRQTTLPPPGQESQPTVIPSDAALLVSWAAPYGGRSSITGYQVQYKQASHSFWAATIQADNVTSARVSGLTNGVSYDVRVRACAGAVCGDWSTPAGGTPQPAPAVSIANPFVSQSVTLTAPSMSSQTAASYQWQAWSNGAWANQGSASASTTLSASSSSAQALAYRVIVTYGTGAATTTATSSAVLVEWSAVAIDITANNPFPVTTGDAADRKVTLTAGGDVPSGATYQWQVWSGTAWANLGTASTTAAEELSSTTKKYQVVVSYRKTSSATSELISATSQPVHVTWDLGATLREITNALSESVPAPTTGGDSGASGQAPALSPQQSAYVTAETALLSCVSGAPATSGGGVTHASFAALMTQYTSSTKTLLDSGACSTQATSAWTAVTALFSSTLTIISTTGDNAVAINAFLTSDPGQSFKAHMLSDESLRGSIGDFIVPAAAIMASEPAGTPPGAGGQQGEDEDRDDDYVGICLKFAGIGANDNANEAPLAKRLATLNCLIFRTPYSFWSGLAGEENASDLSDYFESLNGDPLDEQDNGISWLHSSDDLCSVPGIGRVVLAILGHGYSDSQGEKAACLKHDLSWGTLQRSIDPESEDSATELDSTWNPRNKHLADAVFYADNLCQDISVRTTCLEDTDIFWAAQTIEWSSSEAARRTWGVAEANDLGWPVTSADLAHARDNRHYVACGSPPVPTLDVVSAAPRPSADRTFDAVLTARIGCIEHITIESYTVVWKVTYRGFLGSLDLEYKVTGHDFSSPGSKVNTLAIGRFEASLYGGIRSVQIVRIETTPNNRAYGGGAYSIPVNLTVSSDT